MVMNACTTVCFELFGTDIDPAGPVTLLPPKRTLIN
jgi:hypothetical protein